MSIRQKYRNFLRQLVNAKYLNKFKSVKVLGENLINGQYFVVIEVIEQEKLEEIFNGINK